MEIFERDVQYYVTPSGKAPFQIWFNSLKDIRAQMIIDARIERLKVGNLGQFGSVGRGVFELKISYGPGYRVYFCLDRKTKAVLLYGGKKGTQKGDITKAHVYSADFFRRRK